MFFFERTGLQKLLFLKAAAGGSVVEDTVTGNPLSFQTDLAKPLKSLLIPFTPQQEGSGDPLPSNVRNIVPWNGLTVWGAGKNLVDKTQLEDGMVWWQGNKLTGYANNCVSPKIPVVPGATYFRQGNTSNQNSVSWFDKNGDYISQESWGFGYAKTIPVNAYFVGMTFGKDYKDEAMLFVGNTASAYVPYKPITETDISFASPVYGGTLDVVSGVLTVEYVTVDLGSLSWTYNSDRFYTTGLANVIKRGASARRLVMYCPIFLCISDGRSQANVPDMSMYEGDNGNVFIHDSSYTDKDAFKEAMDGIVLCYPLATPQTVQLTPEQITALVGNNTLWSDADGEMTAIYYKKG